MKNLKIKNLKLVSLSFITSMILMMTGLEVCAKEDNNYIEIANIVEENQDRITIDDIISDENIELNQEQIILSVRMTSQEETSYKLEFELDSNEIILYTYEKEDLIKILKRCNNIKKITYVNINNLKEINILNEILNPDKIEELDIHYHDLENNTQIDNKFLFNFKNLKSLYIGISSTDNLERSYSMSTESINNCRNLENLNIINYDHNCIVDYEQIDDNKNLDWINISGTKGLADISFLSRFPNLTTVFLHNTSISDVSVIPKLKKLECLSITDSDISDISPLYNMRQLDSIGLEGNHIKKNELDILQRNGLITLKEKKRLISTQKTTEEYYIGLDDDLMFDITPEDVINDEKIKISYETLSIVQEITEGNKIKYELSFDGKNTSIKLNLDIYEKEDLISVLNRCDSIDSIWLSIENVDNVNILDIIPNPYQVKRLNITYYHHSNEPISNEAISNFKNLESLSICLFDFANNDNGSSMSIEVVNNLEKLTFLDISNIGNSHTVGYDKLAENGNLFALYISGDNNFDDISFITKFPSLSILFVNNTNLSDITPLTKTRNLHYVYLQENSISSEDLDLLESNGLLESTSKEEMILNQKNKRQNTKHLSK